MVWQFSLQLQRDFTEDIIKVNLIWNRLYILEWKNPIHQRLSFWIKTEISEICFFISLITTQNISNQFRLLCVYRLFNKYEKNIKRF